MGIPESLFWDEDMRFIDRVLTNKAAYDGWFHYAMKKERERRNG